MVLWQEQEEWIQIEPFLLASCANMEGLPRLKRLTEIIAEGMTRLNGPMQGLCRSTCPDCDDNCCMRATVYYDLKDLLFLHFHSGKLPKQQIIRSKSCSCPNLSPQGCILPRQERPFVCTWYLCPRQKEKLYKGGEKEKLYVIENTIKVIQVTRKKLEDTFVDRALSKDDIIC